MGTREVYEEKLRSSNLYHDPTMNPGLGSPRCPRCLSLLNTNVDNGEWTITSVLHDATAVECNYVPCFLVLITLQWLDLLGRIAQPLSKLGCDVDDVCSRCTLREWDWKWSEQWLISAGSGIGGMLSAIHGFNTGIPYFQKHVKGPKWLPFLIGLPPLLMFSAASVAFGGYALPKFAQLTVTSYYAASSASHYGISLLTRHIEDSYTSHVQQKRLG